jgi:hypothetical protein
MITFKRTIGKPEVKSTYLNLTGEDGITYGSRFPAHRTPIIVVDGRGRRTSAQKHHDNQLWGSIKNWFVDNDIRPGTRIEVKYDPRELSGERINIVHLVPLEHGKLGAMPENKNLDDVVINQEEAASEIPLSLEKQLEDFIAANLEMIEIGLKLYRDEEGREGRQYPTDVGIIDLLCVKTTGDYLVIELKRSRSSDVVVGQISRYMGWIGKHLSRGKNVYGLVLTYERDDTLKYAVIANPNIELKRYKLRLELIQDED